MMMKNEKELRLAEQIIQLDLLRDELYEELLKTFGCRTHEFLRTVQNRHAAVGDIKELERGNFHSNNLTLPLQC
jgi:hypothetical protein